MSRPIRIDLFCEDRAHEEFLRPLLRRLCREELVTADIAVRSARGGHPRALRELGLYQQLIVGGGLVAPDLLVVGRDTNCSSYSDTVREIAAKVDTQCFPHCALACPNPHIELWYMADTTAFERVVGATVSIGEPQCGKQTRNALKRQLADAVQRAGHPVLFGGIQFAQELAEEISPFRMGKVDPGVRHFVDAVVGALRQLTGGRSE